MLHLNMEAIETCDEMVDVILIPLLMFILSSIYLQKIEYHILKTILISNCFERGPLSILSIFIEKMSILYSLLIIHYFYTALRTSILYLFLISPKKNI
jgi:hypothetical protein